MNRPGSPPLGLLLAVTISACGAPAKQTQQDGDDPATTATPEVKTAPEGTAAQAPATAPVETPVPSQPPAREASPELPEVTPLDDATYALVDPRARFHVAPDESSRSIDFYSSDGSSAASWLAGVRLVFRVVAWHGKEWARLATVPEVGDDERHCQQRVVALHALELDLFVRRERLVPVLTRPLEIANDDGTAIRLKPGIALLDTNRPEVKQIFSGETRATMPVPADAVGVTFAGPPEVFTEAEPVGHFDPAVWRSKLPLGDGIMRLGKCNPPRPIAIEKDGSHRVATVRLTCAELDVRLPKKQVLTNKEQIAAEKKAAQKKKKLSEKNQFGAVLANMNDPCVGSQLGGPEAWRTVTEAWGYLSGLASGKPAEVRVVENAPVYLDDGTRIGRVAMKLSLLPDYETEGHDGRRCFDFPFEKSVMVAKDVTGVALCFDPGDVAG